MQESEARKKWCPMARIPYLFGTDAATTGNRKADDWTESLCLGSDCMSWRWMEQQWKCSGCGAIFDRYHDECPDDFTENPKCKVSLEIYNQGFCGLSGK